MDFDSADDLLISAIGMDGARRCINERRKGTPVLWPPDMSDFWGYDLAQRQSEAMGAKELQGYQIELIDRADALVKFLESNVGTHVEFPLELRPESAAALKAYEEHVSELRGVIGVLTELE